MSPDATGAYQLVGEFDFHNYYKRVHGSDDWYLFWHDDPLGFTGWVIGNVMTTGSNYPRFYWVGDSLIDPMYADMGFASSVSGYGRIGQDPVSSSSQSSSSSSSSSSDLSDESSSSSSVILTPEQMKVMQDRYRFSGFQMPTVTLDDGFEYAVSLDRSEYTQGEPGWWHEQATYEGGGLDGFEYSNPGGDVPIL